jgi:hypothetical protein
VAQHRLPAPDSRYFVHEPNARVLRPDWDEFVSRDELCETVQQTLADDRTYVSTLTGVGGVGKTAVACWAVLRAYERQQFEFIVSVSAKDRELTDRGIQAGVPTLTSFDDLLTQILEVLGFSEFCAGSSQDCERAATGLLPGLSLLLFVDNLETVEDRRVVQFLETLPKPVKAITTSRMARVRTAAFPISVGPFTCDEAVRFFDVHLQRRGKLALKQAGRTEKERIVDACSRLPLAIEWLVGQSRELSSALHLADQLAGSGRRDDELLEFCFRSVHSALTPQGRMVLAALTLDHRPQVLEALAASIDLTLELADEALTDLEGCSLTERVWDARMHDFAFRALPLTRRFAYRELQRIPGEELRMRGRLSDWYRTVDIPTEQREAMVAIRQGATDPDTALVEAAISFRKQGKAQEADQFFRRAGGTTARPFLVPTSSSRALASRRRGQAARAVARRPRA